MTETLTPPWASWISEPEEVGPPKSILIYALPGRWKTTIAATIAKVPGFEKVLLVDIDDGAEVLMNDPVLAAKVRSGIIDIMRIDPLARHSKERIDELIADICANDYGYDAVIFDTLDVAQDVAEKVYKNMYATSGKGGKKDGFAIWGDLGVWTDEIVRKLHSAKHFTAIITVHAKKESEEDGSGRILPKLSGSSKDAIGAIPSIVTYFDFENHPETGERHLVATIGEESGFITKNRYSLPTRIVDLDMPKLYSMIEAKTAAPVAAEKKEVSA